MKNYIFTIIVEQDQDGYFVYCPDFQGCYSQGETYEEALENIKDAIKLHLEDRPHSFELLSQLNFKSVVKDGSTNLDKYIYDSL